MDAANLTWLLTPTIGSSVLPLIAAREGSSDPDREYPDGLLTCVGDWGGRRDREGGNLMHIGKRAAAEALGTFWLVLGGCGSAVIAANFPGVRIGLLGVALAFGLTVLTMAYFLGHI